VEEGEGEESGVKNLSSVVSQKDNFPRYFPSFCFIFVGNVIAAIAAVCVCVCVSCFLRCQVLLGGTGFSLCSLRALKFSALKRRRTRIRLAGLQKWGSRLVWPADPMLSLESSDVTQPPFEYVLAHSCLI